MEVGHAGSEEAAGILEQRNAEGRKETDSMGFRRGDQADFADGDEAIGAAGDQVRVDAWKEERDPGAQRKYSEIHGGRISRLGLRAGAGRVSRADGHGTRELDSG